MLSQHTNRFLRCISRQVIPQCRNSSLPATQAYANEDPAPLFFDKQVQAYLKTLTRVDYAKATRTRKDGHRTVVPTYKFMTDKELQKAYRYAEKRVNQRLQMPPIVKPRPEINCVLSEDPALQGLSTSNYIFTDITYGVKSRDRLIVVREPNGTLRKARYDERERMESIYFPIPGRELEKPKMFDGEYFTDLLNRKEYEFILDRACIQFEPDDPEYHRITQEVYAHVNETQEFERLRSTRHFGPLAFYLTWNKDIDNLLIDIINNKKIEEAVALVKLFYKIHSTASLEEEIREKCNMELVKYYADSNSVRKIALKKAILVYEELENVAKEVEKGIQAAHGIALPTENVDQ